MYLKCISFHLSTVVHDVLPEVRAALHSMVFSDIFDVTEKDMASIMFGLYKVACMAPTEEQEDDEFYVKSSDRKYFVHRINDENEFIMGLVSFL